MGFMKTGKVPALPPRCYLSHPHIKFKNIPGILVGGSCLDPFPAADINIGLSWDMQATSRRLPWNQSEGHTFEFVIPIIDMEAPSAARMPEFQRAVTWVIERLREGDVVHVGCYGGHGRTGTFITAVVAELYDLGLIGQAQGQELLCQRKFIQWVRRFYCPKAVETLPQIHFLRTEYGAKVAPALKTIPKPSKRSNWFVA